jgi:GNAT superfamily N-acetyltransferase
VFTNAIAMFLDDFLPPPPILIGHYQGLDFFAEGRGFALPRVRDMLTEDPDRYSDLCGRTVGLVMPLLDWSGQKLPFCVTACIDDQVAAAAWAGTITSRETGAQGCNVSFGLRPAFGGKGLATILTAIAYQQCLDDAPYLEFVNVHTEAGNQGARALGAKIGLHRAEMFDRQTRGRTPRLYVAYRAPAAVVTARCAEILAAAGVHVRPPSDHLAGRRQVPNVQPRGARPPSIAALLPPFQGPSMISSPFPIPKAAATPARAASSTAPADNQALRNALAGPHGLLPGIALVENALVTATRASPTDAPFPLVGEEARIYHEGTTAAYVHSLEMVSSDCLRELLNSLGQTPESEADLTSQNQIIAEALFGQFGVTSGAEVIEKCLAVATRAKHADAPFPMNAEQGAVWHRAQRTAYQYVLEMLCTDRLKQMAPQFSALVFQPDTPDLANDEAPAAPSM